MDSASCGGGGGGGGGGDNQSTSTQRANNHGSAAVNDAGTEKDLAALSVDVSETFLPVSKTPVYK